MKKQISIAVMLTCLPFLFSYDNEVESNTDYKNEKVFGKAN
jgi:hypothetical protein